MRPGVALEPGERYIVAVRGLVDPASAPIGPEPAFKALRDGDFTTIDALAARGVRFDRAIAAAPATGPSHASMSPVATPMP